MLTKRKKMRQEKQKNGNNKRREEKAKQLFLLAPQHLRTLREGLSATQRQKFHTDDINQCFIINPVVMGFQLQICSILRFSWSI